MTLEINFKLAKVEHPVLDTTAHELVVFRHQDNEKVEHAVWLEALGRSSHITTIISWPHQQFRTL